MYDTCLSACAWRDYLCIGTFSGALLLYARDSESLQTYTLVHSQQFEYPIGYLWADDEHNFLLCVTRFGVHTVQLVAQHQLQQQADGATSQANLQKGSSQEPSE